MFRIISTAEWPQKWHLILNPKHKNTKNPICCGDPEREKPKGKRRKKEQEEHEEQEQEEEGVDA